MTDSLSTNLLCRYISRYKVKEEKDIIIIIIIIIRAKPYFMTKKIPHVGELEDELVLIHRMNICNMK
jgi:homoaconitase/3-isopropylmalate dehydratase large subunit